MSNIVKPAADLSASDETLESRVFVERVRQSFAHALGNRIRTLILGIFVWAVLWHTELTSGVLIAWTTVALLTNLAVALVEARYRTTNLNATNALRWARIRTVLGVVAAVPYGAAAFILPAGPDIVPQLLLFIILTAAVAVSSISFTVLPALYLGISAATMGLMTVAFLIRWDAIHLLLVVMAITWQVALLRKAMTVSDSSINAIRTNERLRDEIASHEETRAELVELNHQKDRFFSIIAHDLLGPFTVLLNYSQILKSSAKTVSREKIAEFSANLNEATEGVLGLVNNLLSWSRVQMDRLEIEVKPLAIDVLAREAVKEIGFMANEKNIRITLNAEPVRAEVDAQMSRTILRNLIANAVKFTPEGGAINIRVETRDKMAEISVADDGVGMDADKVETLFELGAKGSTSGTRGETGTGLGLLLCREFVEKQGGQISVVSAPNEGSTFSFTLPLSGDSTTRTSPPPNS